jgi:hypothetical protein
MKSLQTQTLNLSFTHSFNKHNFQKKVVHRQFTIVYFSLELKIKNFFINTFLIKIII